MSNDLLTEARAAQAQLEQAASRRGKKAGGLPAATDTLP